MSELFSNPDHTIMLRRDQPYLAGPYAATLNNMGLSLLAQGRSAQALNAFNRVRLLSTFALTTDPSEIEAWDRNGRFTLPEPEFSQQNDPAQYLPSNFFQEDGFDSSLIPQNYSDAINQILQQTSVPFLSDGEWENIFRDVYFEPISTSPQYNVATDTTSLLSVYNFLTDYKDTQTRSLINLGEWYNIQEDDLSPLKLLPNRAVNLLAQAYQSKSNKTPPSDMAMLYAHLGKAFAKIGEVEKAKILYERSLSLYFQIQDLVGIATVFTDLAQVYTNSGDSNGALQYYEVALSILSKINLPTQETEARFGYAYALSLNDKFLEAIEEYRIGIQIFEDQIANAAVDTAIAETVNRRETNSPYHNIAGLLVKHVKTPEAIAEALLLIEKGNAILARTELAEKPTPIRLELGGFDKRLLLQREDMLYLVWRSGILLAIIRDLEKKAPYDNAAKEDLQERYARSGSPHSEPEARRSYALAQLEFTEINNLMAIEQGLITRQIAAVPSIKTIQATIPPDTTLLVYSIGQKESLAFIITNKTINVSVLAVTHEQLGDFSDEVISSDTLSISPIYANLYSAFIAPINNLLQTPYLAIVPDKELTYMPFAAFELPDGRKLIDEHIIWNLHSLSSYVLLANRSYSEKAATAGLILGNTQAVIDPSGPLSEIGYVKEEVEAIAKQLGVDPLLDNSATELTFRRRAGSSEIIHVSAHGILDPEFPSFSSLALAYNSSEMTISDMYDGNLWAEEVYALDLTHGTQLVVLSGCDTASGGNGEDFGVLTRAFLVAGSPRVMASLWPVPDHEATVLLMQKFYEYRSTVANDAIALKEAMLSVRQLYPNPFYWAGFTLYGVLGTEVANKNAFAPDDKSSNEEFTPLTFCTENDFDLATQACTTSETVFRGTVKSVHLSWNPPNQYRGKLFTRVWYLDGNQFLANENYSNYAYIEVATRNSLKPGKYLVELFVEGKLVQSGNFEIQ
jgi:CHAT domain-containing protein